MYNDRKTLTVMVPRATKQFRAFIKYFTPERDTQVHCKQGENVTDCKKVIGSDQEVHGVEFPTPTPRSPIVKLPNAKYQSMPIA